ncbi:MAG: DUF2207 domain-containing protein [Actinomycetaceae bacterium]|nr:DUF2207 domain-containing protein [Actinomycetaceae bacterium]
MKKKISIVLVVLLMGVFVVGCSGEKYYEMPQTTIKASILADGTLNVRETRSFEFHGDFSAVWWKFGGFPKRTDVSVNSVYYGVRGDGTAMQKCSEAEFKDHWREHGGAGPGYFSIDKEKEDVYVFFKAYDETYDFTIDYSIKNIATRHDEYSELYWKFVSDGWTADSENVTVNVKLPVPGGEKIVPGDNVRAWGHGDLGGTLTFHPDKQMVSAHMPHVSGDQFGEVRIIMPSEWMSEIKKVTQPMWNNRH